MASLVMDVVGIALGGAVMGALGIEGGKSGDAKGIAQEALSVASKTGTDILESLKKDADRAAFEEKRESIAIGKEKEIVKDRNTKLEIEVTSLKQENHRIKEKLEENESKQKEYKTSIDIQKQNELLERDNKHEKRISEINRKSDKDSAEFEKTRKSLEKDKEDLKSMLKKKDEDIKKQTEQHQVVLAAKTNEMKEQANMFESEKDKWRKEAQEQEIETAGKVSQAFVTLKQQNEKELKDKDAQINGKIRELRDLEDDRATEKNHHLQDLDNQKRVIMEANDLAIRDIEESHKNEKDQLKKKKAKKDENHLSDMDEIDKKVKLKEKSCNNQHQHELTEKDNQIEKLKEEKENVVNELEARLSDQKDEMDNQKKNHDEAMKNLEEKLDEEKKRDILHQKNEIMAQDQEQRKHESQNLKNQYDQDLMNKDTDYKQKLGQKESDLDIKQKEMNNKVDDNRRLNETIKTLEKVVENQKGQLKEAHNQKRSMTEKQRMEVEELKEELTEEKARRKSEKKKKELLATISINTQDHSHPGPSSESTNEDEDDDKGEW